MVMVIGLADDNDHSIRIDEVYNVVDDTEGDETA